MNNVFRKNIIYKSDCSALIFCSSPMLPFSIHATVISELLVSTNDVPRKSVMSQPVYTLLFRTEGRRLVKLIKFCLFFVLSCKAAFVSWFVYFWNTNEGCPEPGIVISLSRSTDGSLDNFGCLNSNILIRSWNFTESNSEKEMTPSTTMFWKLDMRIWPEEQE